MLFGFQLVASIVILRMQGDVLGERSALSVAVIYLVAGEENELGSYCLGCLCQMDGGDGIDEITFLRMLLAITSVGYGRYVQ